MAEFWLWVARKLPRKLIYWAAIVLIAEATRGEYENQIVPDLTAMDAIKRWRMK